jgi:hypothetical protein
MNSYDIDGVIYINKEFTGVCPGPDDIIITGRSFQEKEKTLQMLFNRKIYNKVYFNDLEFEEKTRKSSGIHKGNTLNFLKENGIVIDIHFEDDEIQIEEIKKVAPWVNIIHLVHNLTEKENKLPD